ncbi:syntaxin-related protein KNOLLE-like [Dendrobium catenatum]|uniref:Syntaxin-related protein KNOLLE n=1 Tax=Dendrobium catenatum TaxID=906689 RepID=A0A2I0W0H0_9ASPA|nr:syntaxin-related protein KNOLLE-like [Dendrobium catenatum]PKU69138.1 Syntaxin-related protein KNOLLE [Dendrobium catenatum]
MNNLMTKSFLSYADLKKEAVKDLEAGGGDETHLEIQMSKAEESLRIFFEEAGQVEEEMVSIRELLALLKAASEESKLAHKQDVSRAVRDRINNHILEVLKATRRIRGRLEAMDRSNAANRRLSGCREGTAVDRTRTLATNGLRKKLKELMTDFQRLRQRMMADYREEVERRYFTLTGEVPPEEVVEKIISEGKSEELLKKAICSSGRGLVTETLSEIQDRHDAAKVVEKSLLELHQLFLDMAVIVEVQGEKMDNIEHHVSNASHYIKGGTKELNHAKIYQRSSRKWFCLAILLLLVLVLLIVIPIASSLSKS